MLRASQSFRDLDPRRTLWMYTDKGRHKLIFIFVDKTNFVLAFRSELVIADSKPEVLNLIIVKN
jgi:hypothetical protein